MARTSTVSKRLRSLLKTGDRPALLLVHRDGSRRCISRSIATAGRSLSHVERGQDARSCARSRCTSPLRNRQRARLRLGTPPAHRPPAATATLLTDASRRLPLVYLQDTAYALVGNQGKHADEQTDRPRAGHARSPDPPGDRARAHARLGYRPTHRSRCHTRCCTWARVRSTRPSTSWSRTAG